MRTKTAGLMFGKIIVMVKYWVVFCFATCMKLIHRWKVLADKGDTQVWSIDMPQAFRKISCGGL